MNMYNNFLDQFGLKYNEYNHSVRSLIQDDEIRELRRQLEYKKQDDRKKLESIIGYFYRK